MSLQNYGIDFRSACAAGAEPFVTWVADLLADPAFAPLKEWLLRKQVDVDELQAEVDRFLEQARQMALK